MKASEIEAVLRLVGELPAFASAFQGWWSALHENDRTRLLAVMNAERTASDAEHVLSQAS